MSQRVKLHGGPMGGVEMDMSSDSNYLYIMKMIPPKELHTEDTGKIVEVEKSKGRYSRVGTSTTQFEWDGWGH